MVFRVKETGCPHKPYVEKEKVNSNLQVHKVMIVLYGRFAFSNKSPVITHRWT